MDLKLSPMGGYVYSLTHLLLTKGKAGEGSPECEGCGGLSAQMPAPTPAVLLACYVLKLSGDPLYDGVDSS